MPEGMDNDHGSGRGALVGGMHLPDMAYRVLVELIPCIVYLLDGHGNITFLGGSFEKLTGLKASKYEGQPFLNLVWHEDKSNLQWSFPLKGCAKDTNEHAQVRLRTKGGEEYKFFDLTYSRIDLRPLGVDMPRKGINRDPLLGIFGIGVEIPRRRLSHVLGTKASESLLRERDRYRKICGNLIDWIEKQRSHVASVIRNEICERLVGLKMELQALKSKIDFSSQDVGTDIEYAIRKASEHIGRMKDKAESLRPKILDTLGIAPAIAQLVEKAKRRGRLNAFVFTKNVPADLPSSKQLALYRITEEAINNTIRHSKAEELFISIIGTGETIVLTIEDDGEGFEVEKSVDLSPGAMGLCIMREWATKVGGRFSIESKLGGGTRIWVEIPI